MKLDAWIAARRAEGCWVTSCPSCGYFFAQDRHHTGRRAIVCEWHRCVLWQRWRRTYGRAPPSWLMEKWRVLYGDASDLLRPRRPYDRAHRRTAEVGDAAEIAQGGCP